MSLQSANVIPGNHGKVFETNAENISDLEKIRMKVSSLDGVKDVILNNDVFPREITVHTSKIVKVEAVQREVIAAGFHAVPKTLFGL